MSTPDTTVQPEPGLTVDELAARLAEISSTGKGDWRTGVTYRAVTPSLTGTPVMPVTGATAGFDWTRGRVLLATQRTLSADADSVQSVSKRADKLSSTLYLAQRIINKAELTDAERIAQLKTLFERKLQETPAPVIHRS
jgi:hypothetical protein